jgi:hypothetical protein
VGEYGFRVEGHLRLNRGGRLLKLLVTFIRSIPFPLR